MRTLRIICRTLVGLTFIFSGFVKAVDPLGSTYKFQEYFEVYGMEWLHNFALPLAIILCAVEFSIGVMLLFGVKPKLSAWLSLIMMSFFTVLTLLSAINNPVSDCGCFGDAVKLTNWETFYKNIVLMVLVLFLVFTLKKSKPAFGIHGEYYTLVLGIGIIVFVSIYSLRHLPIIDFLPWKKGVKISEQVLPTPEVADVYLVYKNKKTGEKLEYTAKTLPWQDSVLMSNIEFVEQKKKIIQPFKEAPIHDFVISDQDGNIITDQVMGYQGKQFLMVAYDLNSTNKDAFLKMNKFAEASEKDSIPFVALTGSIPEIVDAFRHDIQAMYPFYTVDETALKSVVRASPGLVLLDKGVVIMKWHYHDFPEYSVVKEKYLK
jgi:uncharacterized membrane protein YphA (DoxX/SURF4 family)